LSLICFRVSSALDSQKQSAFEIFDIKQIALGNLERENIRFFVLLLPFRWLAQKDKAHKHYDVRKPQLEVGGPFKKLPLSVR